jgi:hypothetical protein
LSASEGAHQSLSPNELRRINRAPDPQPPPALAIDYQPMLTARLCQAHPQRAAFAVCMTCRKPLCQECATQWDGIYHCAQCLAVQRGALKGGSRVTGWLAAGAASLILLYLTARVMVWAGAFMAGLF